VISRPGKPTIQIVCAANAEEFETDEETDQKIKQPGNPLAGLSYWLLWTPMLVVA